MSREARDVYLAEAMAKAQRGDQAAYREVLESIRVIIKLYSTRILKRIGRYDPGIAEDMTQDVLLAVHQKRHTYDPSQPLLPWLFSITRYKIIDYGRRERRRPTSSLEGLEEALAAPVLSEAGTERDLAAILATLPARTREVLEMVKLEGLSVAEAAARTQLSESNVKVLVHRALKTLRGKAARGESL